MVFDGVWVRASAPSESCSGRIVPSQKIGSEPAASALPYGEDREGARDGRLASPLSPSAAYHPFRPLRSKSVIMHYSTIIGECSE